MPTIIATDTQNGDFESRANLVKLISRTETPFISDIGFERVFNRLHYWSYQLLKTPASGSTIVEGAAVSHGATDMIARTQDSNAVQNNLEAFQVSFDEDAVRKPQIGSGDLSEFDNQSALALKELKKDIDASALSNNTAVTPAQDSTTAGVAKGAQKFITNSINASDVKYGDGTLTQEMFDEATRKTYKNGGMITNAYGGSFQVSRISRFVSRPDRNISEQGTKLVDMVDVYKNSVGATTQINIDPQMDILFDDVLLLLQLDLWKIGYLRAPQSYREGLDATANKGFVNAAWTLMCFGPTANCKITNLRKES